MNGMRQPHADACSAPSHSVDQPRRPRPEDEPQRGAGGGGTADQAAPRGRGLLGGVDHRPGELAAEREALDDAQDHEQDRRGDADLRVGRQQPDQQRRAAHQRDRQRQQRAASDAVAHHAEHEAAERPRAETQREDGKGQQLLGGRARLREELTADVAGEVAVDGKVEPLEDVADQAGQRGPKRGLRRDGGTGAFSGQRRSIRDLLACRIIWLERAGKIVQLGCSRSSANARLLRQVHRECVVAAGQTHHP